MDEPQTDTDYRGMIRRTGLRLFAERGVQGVSVAQLCREADIANGTFYNFYRNKSELVAEFLTETYEGLARNLRDAEGGGGSAEEEHRRDVTIIVDFTVANADLIQVALRDEGARRLAEKDIVELFIRQRTDGLRRGTASGLYRGGIDPMLVAQAEHGLMAQIIGWWLENPAAMSRAHLIEQLVAIRLRITNGRTED